MTGKTEGGSISYRWVMLSLVWIISATGGWAGMATTPLAKQVMADLNMDYGMLMAALGAPAIIPIFMALPSGIIADRFGMKRMIIIAGIVRGFFGILTGFSTSYLQFLIFSILFCFL